MTADRREYALSLAVQAYGNTSPASVVVTAAKAFVEFLDPVGADTEREAGESL